MGSPHRRRIVAVGAATLVVSVLLASLVAASPGPAGANPSASCPSSPTTDFGAPAWALGCHLGGQGFTSPVVGTVDGVKVVVDASLSGMVYMVNALTGREMPGWPQRSTLVGNTATAIDSSPAIGYLDGPNKPPSIVVGLGSDYVQDQNGGLMAWNANGSVRFRYQTKKTFGAGLKYSNGVFATPAIGDITGNGQQDIVFGSWDHYLYALSPSGKPLPGFPLLRADTIWSSPVLADTSHTGKMDIIEGGDSSGAVGPSGAKCYGGWISDYRYESNGPHLVWEHCLAETVWSSPTVSTFGTTPVVVVGTSWYHQTGWTTEPTENEVFAYNADTGAVMPGWPQNAGGPTFGSPVVAPLTAGGANAVIETSCAACTSASLVTAWTQQGKRVWQTNLSSHNELLASASVGSVTGSTTNDVLIGNGAGLYVLDAANGDKIEGTQTAAINPACNAGGTPVISAVPGSKTGDMMFTNCGYAGKTPTDNWVRAYNIPAPPDPAPWPMWRGNAQRTGVPDPVGKTTASCSTPSKVTGYRLVAAAGSVWGFKSSRYCGGLASEMLPENVAGIASMPDGGGYWLALKDGSVYSFGKAKDYGDLRGTSWHGGSGDIAPGAPITGIASSPDGKGYLLLAGDGSVYAFGDAKFHGSKGDGKGSGVPVGIAVDQVTGGYWIVTSSGHVYNFDAPFHGSQASGHLYPMVGMAATSNGKGYWLATSSGGVYAFGSAKSYGTLSGKTVVGIAAGEDNRGYYLADSDGGVHQFGHVRFDGSQAGKTGGDPVVAISTP